MFIDTKISGVKVFEPKIFADQRGSFFESYNKKLFHEAGITCDFVQDNQSISSYGVLRGLHFQTNEHAQAKLVRVLHGLVLDVCVDLRKNSVTFGQYYSIELSSENNKQLFVPRNFAHGFLVLSKTAILAYKCDNFYNKAAESGLNYADPDLQINWLIDKSEMIINQRDAEFLTLKEHKL